MMKTANYSIPARFYSLDILRGLAALAVVLFHWRHCFYNCSDHSDFSAEQQPLYTFLHFFYEAGQKAVELFFTLSGFIFFWLYSRKIESHKVSFKEFSILRLSRLYPLHIATLILVIILQYSYFLNFKCYFVYSFNDFYHFVLQLFFASNWGFQKGFSYNGPIWSVSIEVLLYFIFFVLCWLRNDKTILLVVIAIVSYGIFYYKGYQLSQGLFSFFTGGLTYKFFYFKFNKLLYGLLGKILVIAALLAWTATFIEVQYSIFERWFSVLLDKFSINHKYLFLFDRSIPLYVGAILFPLTILALVILETKRESLGKKIAFIGDISYSSYLLHFPLQLTAVLLINALGYTKAVFESPLVLLIFFIILITISLLSHRYFEIPVQRKLRRMLLKP